MAAVSSVCGLCGTASLAALVSALLAGTALAQPGGDGPAGQATQSRPAATQADAEVRIEEIIVTGTRISSKNPAATDPALTVDTKKFEARGYSNVAEALQELPTFAVPVSPVGEKFGLTNSPGANFADLFGLGSQRTLTLVNGRRFVPASSAATDGGGGGGQVDLNAIPTELIERVEIIAVGGSPIYGSDAISGTINVITKKDYQGIKLDAQAGISGRGDSGEYRLRALGGLNFAGGRGNIVASFEYNKSNGLPTQARNATLNPSRFVPPLDPTSTPFQNILIQQSRTPILSANGIPLVADLWPQSPADQLGLGFQAGVADANGRPLAFDAKGNLIPIDFGRETGSFVFSSGGNGFNLSSVINAVAPVERYLGNVLTHFDVSDHLTLFAEGWYANAAGTALTQQRNYNTALIGRAAGVSTGNLIISLDNPYLSSQARAIIADNLANNPISQAPGFGAPEGTFLLGKVGTDWTTGRARAVTETYRFVTGARGDFSVGERTFNWEISGVYGRSKTTSRQPSIVAQNLFNALNSTTDANGNIVCAPGAVNSPLATLSSVCAPLNPFGIQASDAARRYITTIARSTNVNEQKVVTATLGGDLFRLPGGLVAFSAGFEHREESARYDPGDYLFGRVDPADPTGPRIPYFGTVNSDPVSGRFNTDELFGEARLPLIGPEQAIPFVRSFELNGAARYVWHSLAGGALTWKAGGAWQPLLGATVRGNFTRSIRSPSIVELFSPVSAAQFGGNDPCDARFIAGGPNPAVRGANCAKAGLPPTLNTVLDQVAITGLQGGNQDLRNERANSWTVGVQLRPSRRLTVSADWVSISLTDAISLLSAQQTLNACYDNSAYPSPICNNFTRDGNGQVNFLRSTYVNAASLKYSGLVASASYTIPTPFIGVDSTVRLNANYSYINKATTRVGADDIITLKRLLGYAEHRAVVDATYENGGFSWQWQAQYIGDAVFQPDEAAGVRDPDHISPVVYVSTTLRYNIDKRFDLRLIVNNVANRGMPFASSAAFDPAFSVYYPGLIGRSFKIGVSAAF